MKLAIVNDVPSLINGRTVVGRDTTVFGANNDEGQYHAYLSTSVHFQNYHVFMNTPFHMTPDSQKNSWGLKNHMIYIPSQLKTLDLIKKGHRVHIFVTRTQLTSSENDLGKFIVDAYVRTGKQVCLHIPKSNRLIYNVIGSSINQEVHLWKIEHAGEDDFHLLDKFRAHSDGSLCELRMFKLQLERSSTVTTFRLGGPEVNFPKWLSIGWSPNGRIRYHIGYNKDDMLYIPHCLTVLQDAADYGLANYSKNYPDNDPERGEDGE